MASSSRPAVSTEQRAHLDVLVADLHRVFGARLRSVVVYGLDGAAQDSRLRTLGLVERLTFDDLSRCVPLASGWRRHALAVPLLLTHDEFSRTLDVFPLEYGHIIASHVLIAGTDPFGAAHIADADRRRACELQAKSHLIHLREGFLETMGEGREVARLIAASAPAFRTLLGHIVHLGAHDAVDLTTGDLAALAEKVMGVPATLVAEVLAAPLASGTAVDPTALLARYIDATEHLWRYVDGWRP